MAIDRSLLVRASIGVAICATLGACGGDNQDQSRMQAAVDSVSRTDTVSAGGEVSGASAASTATGTTMSDANIASTIASANGAEIASGRLAEARAHDAAVKAFAKTLVQDHRAFQSRIDAADKASKITPQSPPGADSAQRQATEATDSLAHLSGTAFDRAWIAHEVQDHQQTLADLQRMQGMARSQQLRDAIGQGIAGVQQHLRRAQQLQGKLGT